MKIRRIVVLLFVVGFATASLTAQNSNEQKRGQRFTFRQGQTVYVAAYRVIEHFPSRGFGPIASTNIVDSNHLPAEQLVRREFEKRQVYTLANKASQADFVFLVLIHDSAAEGLALAPEVYSQYRNKLDVEALREAAYARSTIGPLKIHTLGRISDRLVQQFHEEDGRAAKTNP